MSDTPQVDTTRLQGIARAYTQSAVLFTAIDVELFTHVAQGADNELDLVGPRDCARSTSSAWCRVR